MVTRPILTEADHARVTAAVAAAEADTAGEIVTIVARRSDDYRDVALHYAVAAMLLLVGLVAIVPGWAPALAGWHAAGWHDTLDLPWLLFLMLIGQTALFLAVRYALAWTPLRLALTPKATKARRVRRRALQLFRASAEQRTTQRVGILLYLSLDEHDAELVADEAIHQAVPPERWGEAMAALVDHARDGDPAGGMVAAVAAIGTILHEAVPRGPDDRNELPDRLIEL